MTKLELIAYCRTLADDSVKDYLSSIDSIKDFIAEAEDEAAERSLYFRTDSTYDIPVLSGTASYALDEKIVFVNRLKISGESKPLTKTTRRELDFEIADWESNTGTPTMFYQEGSTITLYPIPDANKTLLVDAYRYPIDEMETPLALQKSLVYWVFHRIYSIPDSDTFDKGRSLENLKLFERVFGHKRPETFNRAWRNGSTFSSMYTHEFSG